MIVSLSSVHGSPGVTSWSLLLAAAWPTSSPVERVMLEADAEGGVLAARYGLGVEPGVSGLVAAAHRHRAGSGSFDVAGLARRLGERVWVIPGPESPERAVLVWGRSADEVASVAAPDDRVWLVDAGRLGQLSPGWRFVERSTLSVVVCRGRQEDLVAIPSRVAALHATGADAVAVMVVGPTPYRVEELETFFGTGLVWPVRASRDVSAVAQLALSSRRGRRTWEWREAVGVVAEIRARVSPPRALLSDVVEPVAGDG